jgi:CxxC motif-containing protein (DUF1111 family)
MVAGDYRSFILDQALLWQGGEALSSKQRFVDLPVNQRQRLIRFLKPL